jgi:hypothetical protein
MAGWYVMYFNFPCFVSLVRIIVSAMSFLGSSMTCGTLTTIRSGQWRILKSASKWCESFSSPYFFVYLIIIQFEIEIYFCAC